MSADNGIYILKTPDGKGGFEYRVKHCQSIENIYWDENNPGIDNPEGNPVQVVKYFGECTVLTHLDNALILARGMEKEILDDDFCPILEYGINEIELPHPFSYYVSKCKEKMYYTDWSIRPTGEKLQELKKVLLDD